MTDTGARGTLTELVGGIGELLKNKAVIEALIAGVGAFSAVSRVKNKSSSASGGETAGILDVLPQIMPLLGLFSSRNGDGESSVNVPEDSDGESVAVFGEAEAKNETDAVAEAPVIGGFGADKRENLLLALRPFLSETKVAAADAMISVNRISGLLG